MIVQYDDDFPDEIAALRIVVETVGENAATQDEIDVARVLANLLLRLQRADMRLN